MIKPQLIVYSIAFALNLALNIALVYGVDALGIEGMGFTGSPLATTLTRVLQLIGLIVAMYVCRLPLPWCGSFRLEVLERGSGRLKQR